MLRNTVPLYLLIISVLASAAAGFIVDRKVFKSNSPSEEDSDLSAIVCRDKKIRLNGYKFIKPLLFTESECESPEMMGAKAHVQEVVEEYKSKGTIQDASVYLRRLNQGEWLEINGAEQYLPGSLMKVPELITFVKMNELNPGTLDRRVLYEKPFITGKDMHYTSKSIVLGQSYTIRELLTYMIVYSDNNATALLNSIMDLKVFARVFTDLGIPAPDFTARDIPISVNHFSRFMRTIFNATYLTMNDSEFCAELLSKSDFANGIRSGVPADIPIAHKFGEAGNANYSCFSETAIVYVSGSPYLITVMTKGKDLSALPAVVKDIAKAAHEVVAS